MASKSKSRGPDADTHVLWEDQKKINKFAQLNARLDDTYEEIKVKEKLLKNLEDSESELLILSVDENEKVPYQMGDMFVRLSVEEVQEILNSSKEATEKEIMELKEKQDEIKKTMEGLKIELYNKFGDSINLEAE